MLLCPNSARAAFVYETPAEFLTSGDFNGDGIPDVLVLDKPTGNARVGYQDGTGGLTWSSPLVTGVENVTGCGIGHFLQSSRDSLAVTSADYNRVPLLDLANTNSASTPFVVTSVGIGPHTLVGLARAKVPPLTTRDMLVTASAYNSPLAERLELTGFTPPPIVASTFGPYDETGLFERGNELQPATNGPTFAMGLVRGATNDALHLWQFTNSASVIGALSNLPAGSDYTFGRFNDEALPRFWFYVPGGTNVSIRSLLTNGAGFDFSAATALNFTQAVEHIYVVGASNDSSAMIQFGDGIQGARLPGGSPSLAAKYAVGAGAHITGVAALNDGKFVLLNAPTGSVSSVGAQVMTFDGTNYTQISSNNLPAVTTRNTRATVWLFQSEPFTNTAATLIASLNVPDWSSGVSGLPGSLSVRAENDSGAASGLGSPATNSLGVPPAGTVYALPDQYRDDISFFTYAPARPAEPVVITIVPPAGAYGGPIQISFIKQNAGHQVFFRVGMADSWKLYSAPFALTNDATIQYYGNIPGSTRGRLQFASYTMGRADSASEPPVKLPGSDTNPPPVVNPNVPQISASGTAFYGRRGSNTVPTIWAINLDGSGETFLTTGREPRVSRDGRWMAFWREHDPLTNQFSLWLRDVPAGQESRWHTSGNRYVGCDWQIGNTNLIFATDGVFWRIGLNEPPVAFPLSRDPKQGAPSVNLVDGRVAFQVIDSVSIGLYVAPSNLTSRQNLRLNIPSPRWPAWSPDGGRIVVADNPNLNTTLDAGRNLWVVKLGAQTNIYQITALTGLNRFPNGAVWRPDGAALVAAGTIFGTNGLWVLPLSADGTDCDGPPLRLPTSSGDAIDFAGSVIGTLPTVSYANLGLFIRLEPTAIVVYWSTNYDGFTLESAANLPAGFTWKPVSGPYFRAGPNFEYRESRAALQTLKFFRLRYPGVLILTPPEPELMFHVELNAAVFNWPLNYVGYTLEATTNLSPPALWTPLNGPYLNTNGVFEYRRALPGPPQEFYRLRWP